MRDMTELWLIILTRHVAAKSVLPRQPSAPLTQRVRRCPSNNSSGEGLNLTLEAFQFERGMLR